MSGRIGKTNKKIMSSKEICIQLTEDRSRSDGNKARKEEIVEKGNSNQGEAMHI